ncbi:MFS transporter [Citrobacter sp. Cf141]|uniref:MFS transporter n=1 Tax=Citrobacter sp. Cf141 TaxID=2985084 RepID=UPI0025773E14|nr:MFS transporter [Citrobacter sp. Cf141]MDM3084379.1 MFS transporter [Citrobacter sp. Cf141]
MALNTRSAVYLIALGAFALGMASYVTAGLIPMIQTSFSVSAAIAAQLVTAFTLAYGLGSPVFVALLPAHQQRRGLLFALGLFVIANAASALSTDFTVLLIFRAIAGVGAGIYLAMGIAAAAALSEPDQRGKAISVIMGGMASGTVLGVPLSLLLAERFGWAIALWLVALLGAISFIGLITKLPMLPKAQTISLKQKLMILSDMHVVSILFVSLLAAIASLGMYTFIAPLLSDADYGAVHSVTPYLWVWGIGGVIGSFLIGPLVDRFQGPVLSFSIMVILAISLFLLSPSASMGSWFVMIPIAVWGAVGWALQVPQNNELIKARELQGDGNLAVALNESALYLGSAIGAAMGGILLLQNLSPWLLAATAGVVAGLGAFIQFVNIKKHSNLRQS